VSLGVYIHIPFCLSRCGYCHFISLPFDEATADRYWQAVLQEIASFPIPVEGEEVQTIYLGGGTPSLLSAEQIEGLLGECKNRFRISEDCEVSLEANPGTLSADKAAHLRKAGVNRISLGAQSFADSELSSIGRCHNSDAIRQSLSTLRNAGFVNINMDLLLGLPGQTRRSWRHSLEAVDNLRVPHVSVYMLDLDEPCALSRQAEEGLIDLPGEDLVSDLYIETVEFLAACGLEQYEISNFAQPGYICRHNVKYWVREPVVGFGLGSHSFDGKWRYANSPHIKEYFDAIATDTSAVCWREQATTMQALGETLFLGLRLTRGVDWNRLQHIYARNDLMQFQNSLQELVAEGLIEWKDSIVRLTISGMLLSNEIFQLFV
jgi:oxygen-independent coproporphyrinogen-3 oxidase